MTQITTEMKYTYFILLTTEIYFSTVECASAPDINLEGRILTKTDSKVLQLICSTNIAVQLCTVEILVNKRTHDIIRYYDNNCYHSKLLCNPTVCMCSDDCMSFTLNITVTQDMKNHLYSCVSRIEKEGVTYLANISVIHDGIEGLKLYKKFIVPHRSVSPTQQATTTLSPEITTVSFPLLELFSIVGAVFAFLTFVLLVYWICQKRYCNSKTETREEISSISYPKKKSYTEKSADGDRPYTFELKPEGVLDGDQYGFSEQHTQTGEARFSSFNPDSRLDSRIRSIPNTRSSQMRLEEDEDRLEFCADSRIRSIPNTRSSQMRLEEDEDRLEFCAEGQRFRLHPRCSYADSGISSISNTRSRQMRLDGETSFIVLDNPYTRIPEVIDPRNIGDSTFNNTHSASRSSPPETTSLLDCESNRIIFENYNSCNILRIQDSDA